MKIFDGIHLQRYFFKSRIECALWFLEKIPITDKFGAEIGEGLALVGNEEEFAVCCNIKNEETLLKDFIFCNSNQLHSLE